MKKMLVVVLGLAVSLAVVLPVLAAEQKAELDDVTSAYIATLEADLAYIDALLADGQIAAKQAEFAKKSIQRQIDSLKSGDTATDSRYGYGMMGGRGMMGYGYGMMGGYSMPCGY